eukprot:TRINITY_DN3812_c0_g1_i12.p1 TRINITY_DN3812_c0_g1~~TRINITY_DN3812_c0_g1_i12.p1  ORF type:complete len:364 (-),score=140.03 TRINITY_DN3812_c0_g1_i12:117-1208(-)
MSKNQLKSLLHEGTPERLILYPYGTKSKRENLISVKPSDHALDDLNSLISDKSTALIDSTFDTKAREILMTQRKILSLYLTTEEKTDFAYKLLATNEGLRQDVVFATYVNPPENFLASFGMKAKDLPRVAGLLPSKPDDERPQWPAFLYPTDKLAYMDLVGFFKSAVLQSQNKTDEPKRKGKLTLAQLNSTKDIQEYCVDRTSICFIGLLNAEFGEEGERQLAEQLKILRTVQEKKANSPMEMMWVNVSCHKEILKSFELEEMAVPTLALFAPKKKIVGSMIGKFDLETVQDYVEGIFIGKIKGLMKFEKELVLNEIDCSQIVKKEEERLSEEEREVLKEIIAEEERKKKELKKKAKKSKSDL